MSARKGTMIDLPEATRQELLATIQAGPSNKIAAIVLVRKATGADLAAVKDFVERFGYDAYTKNPTQFAKPWPAPGAKSGCAIAMPFITVMLAGLAVWVARVMG